MFRAMHGRVFATKKCTVYEFHGDAELLVISCVKFFGVSFFVDLSMRRSSSTVSENYWRFLAGLCL